MSHQLNAIISLGQRTGNVRPVTKKEDIDMIREYVIDTKFSSIWFSLNEVYPFGMNGRIAPNCVFILLAREIDARGIFCEDVMKEIAQFRGTADREGTFGRMFIRAAWALNFMPLTVSYICEHDENLMMEITLECIVRSTLSESGIEWARYMIRPDIVIKSGPALFTWLLDRLGSGISIFAEKYPQLLAHFFPPLAQGQIFPAIMRTLAQDESTSFCCLVATLPRECVGDLDAIFTDFVWKNATKTLTELLRCNFWSKVKSLINFGAQVRDEEVACELLTRWSEYEATHSCTGDARLNFIKDVLRDEDLLNPRILICAIECEQMKIIGEQIKRGINLNKPSSSDGRLPLNVALLPREIRMNRGGIISYARMGSEMRFPLMSALLGYDVVKCSGGSYRLGTVDPRFADPFLGDANGTSAFDILIGNRGEFGNLVFCDSFLNCGKSKKEGCLHSQAHSVATDAEAKVLRDCLRAFQILLNLSRVCFSRAQSNFSECCNTLHTSQHIASRSCLF